MKNIHLLPIDKPSRIRLGNNGNFVIANFEQSSIRSKNDSYTNQHIYITYDEEIKEGDWLLIIDGYETYVHKHKGDNLPTTYWKTIILTTDQDLIKDEVQAIDDSFLEWFVKNPSREKVEVDESNLLNTSRTYLGVDKYKIIIPQEEPKQETVEEAAKKRYIEGVYVINGIDICDASRECFIAGANYQAERMYSEEDLRKAFKHGILFKEESVSTCEEAIATEFSMLVEQFKKK
jgi:hypothetical protein